MNIVQHVLSVINLNGQLDIKGGQRAQIGNAEHQQRRITKNRAEGLQYAGFMRVRYGFDIPFFHPAKAPPHAEQPADRKNDCCNQITQRRGTGKQRLNGHKTYGTKKKANGSAALSPCGELGPLMRILVIAGTIAPYEQFIRL